MKKYSMPTHKTMTHKTLLSYLCAAALLTGCSAVNSPLIPEALTGYRNTQTSSQASDTNATNATAAATAKVDDKTTGLFETPKMPPPLRIGTAAAPPPVTPVDDHSASSVNIENLALPQFIETVYGTVLKRNISIDPSILPRKEMVSLKTSKPQTPQQLFGAARAVLRSYAVTVTEYEGGLVRFTPDSTGVGGSPEIRRGRANPDVPQSLRPVFYLVELENISAVNSSQWIRTIFGTKINVTEDNPRNALLMNGPIEDLTAAVQAVQILDQPLLRGRVSARIAPVFLAAEELARRLVDILTAQGYGASSAVAATTPILVVPIQATNAVIVFASNETTLNHTLRWAKELDQPGKATGAGGYFTYAVQNTDAAALAKTLQEIMGATFASGAAPAGASSVAVATRNTKVVVNPATNSLIIQGTPTDYQQFYSLLRELDRPAKTALVTVTVAEVRLTDGEQLGFEWLMQQLASGGLTVNLSTMGAFGTAGIGGLSAVINTAAGDPRAILNALASTSKVKVLSNPSIMTRNGESATIQVGQEVPVVSSQQSTATTGLPSGTVLQTIQYRSTGVILKVKPVIHAGGRIDLEVSQEVSSAASTQSGVTASPTISTRKIDTKLTVMDGSTVMLGGLMQQNVTGADSGVPLFKDIPVVGNLFKSQNRTMDRTELVILITPYVVNDEFEAQALTRAFRGQFEWSKSTAEVPLLPRVPGTPAEPGAATAPALPVQPSVTNATTPERAGAAPKVYVLPDKDAPERPPLPQSTGTATSAPQGGATQTPGAAATDTGAAAPRPPVGTAPGNKAVTDPRLIEELQKAIGAPR